MADNKMLIDATHPEETRVVVLRAGRVEEFDYESAARKLLRGNIYLAKVTRVEPALQAAFVDYGGNRHGFLAFNEIHPDYYQIPVADRLALIEEEAAAEAEEEAAADARAEAMATRRRRRRSPRRQTDPETSEAAEATESNGAETSEETAAAVSDDESEASPQEETAHDPDTGSGLAPDTVGAEADEAAHNNDDTNDAAPDATQETVEPADDTDGDDTDGNDDSGGKGTTMLSAMPPDPTIKGEIPQSTDEDGSSEAEGIPTDAVDGAESALSAAVDADEIQPVEATKSNDETPNTSTEETPADFDTTDTEEQTTADGGANTSAPEATVADSNDADEAEDAEAEAADVTADAGEDTDDDGDAEQDGEQADSDDEAVDEVGNEDALEELPVRPRRTRRSYKIQEVIKRRQVILIQVVKEERGNKGAALTTYLSLAGRYTVLMPNTARGGGISRKITNPQDRKRLKAIAADLEVPEGMGLIIRTAGASRTDAEIRRDFEYLLRLWESVRDVTLQSTAPNLVYEEGDLIKRSIRDLYDKDVDEIIVAGEEAHKDAKEFMGMLMPSHADNVTLYEHPEPLFTRYQIERQLNAMFSPYVTLKSGGYLVINQAEALVAIDVNSGRSTREFSIEETALNTNLEAAAEIARQLKLRDLAGLIVIDFIDMDERRNNRAVERRLKDALRHDRARIQVGHISHFGLLEMSRQRMRTGVLEGSTSQCPHCQGTGIIRSTESVALAVLRGLEDAVMAGSRSSLIATATPSVALYILNKKRDFIVDMEARLGLPVVIEGSDKLAGANFTIEKGPAQPRSTRRADKGVVNMDWGFEGDAENGTTSPSARSDDDAGGDDGSRRKRRRRRRGGRRDERTMPEVAEHEASAGPDNGAAESSEEAAGEDAPAQSAQTTGSDSEDSEAETRTRRRRRGRRGGRRGRERKAQGAEAETGDTEPRQEEQGEGVEAASGNDNQDGSSAKATQADHPGLGPQPEIGTSENDRDAGAATAEITDDASQQVDNNDDSETKSRKPKTRSTRGRTRRRKTTADSGDESEVTESAAVSEDDHATKDEQRPKRTRKAAESPQTGESSKTVDDNVGEAAASAPERRRSTPKSTSPRLERVSVGPASAESHNPAGDETNAPETPSSGEPTAPTRKGWWQRRFLNGD